MSVRHQARNNMKTKIIRSEAWIAMNGLVRDEFRDIRRNGMIVITEEEMTNVCLNILVEFMRFKGMLKSNPYTKE